MSVLFYLGEGYEVRPRSEVFLMWPYSEIWDRDRSGGKEVALKEFAYIEFMGSLLESNPFFGYSEDVKRVKVREAVFRDMEWEPDKLVEEGIRRLVEYQTDGNPAWRLYQTALRSVESLESVLREIDFRERDKHGRPIWKVSDVNKAMRELDEMFRLLKDYREKVHQEAYNRVRVSGDKLISYFAEPDNFRVKRKV